MKEGDCLCPQGVVALGAGAHRGSLDKGRHFTFKFSWAEPGSEAATHTHSQFDKSLEDGAKACVTQYRLVAPSTMGVSRYRARLAPHNVAFLCFGGASM